MPRISLVRAAQKLADTCDSMRFKSPVTHCYLPAKYAKEPHDRYLKKFGATRKRTVFWGMNPGPWGMAQTGVPFGEVSAVRDWMGIHGRVSAPHKEHPRRPVLGFECPRSEVSGRRLWMELFAKNFSSAEEFFEEHLVLNYCPLLFSSISGSRCVNITPDKLRPAERNQLFQACDDFVRTAADILQPERMIGIGGFATARLRATLGEDNRIGQILHPSPASPAANRGFAAAAKKQMRRLGAL